MNVTESDIKEFQDVIRRAMDEEHPAGGKRTEIYPYILPGMERYLPEGIELADWSGSVINGQRCCRLVRKD